MVVTPNAAAARVDHTYLKRGVYYFNRRVPLDVSRHYKSRRINFSLRTKSGRAARQSVTAITAQLEGYWQHLRLRDAPVPGAHLLRAANDEPADDGTLRFSEATDLYLRLKGQGKAETFQRAAARACRYLTEVADDKPLSQYVRADAAKLRDRLVEGGLAGSSVLRLFTTVKSIFNFACMETGLEIKNPFAGLYLDREQGVSARKPIPVLVIKQVQAECVRSDDPLRWAVALLSDTGMRLAEVIGLAISDIHLDCAAPFIDLKPHPWRRLKTDSSTRKVPLAGAALWAATRICDSASSKYAFPSYIRDGTCLSNSASGALNKWLKKYVPPGCTVHSFRHSIRDRLRTVEC
ncbi:tyrosine-type recombinase/integrase, partial [bacterium]|nr:tyrosine-type recombinase/integrase [bacterium]